jgi:adenine-specific DNA-methyltransferase
VPYRLLEADDAHSAGDPETPNMLIQGDNLDALKALLPYYAGRVKCIFIDPPYNTRSAFEHYDDNLEHSQWLAMMYPRLELLRELLAEDGSVWVTIDDNEAHYLKVIMDELFGRKNFIGVAAWEKSDSPRMDAVFFSYRHDNVLVFARNIEAVLFKKLPSVEIPAHYNRTDEQGRRYYTKPLRAMGSAIPSFFTRPRTFD